MILHGYVSIPEGKLDVVVLRAQLAEWCWNSAGPGFLQNCTVLLAPKVQILVQFCSKVHFPSSQQSRCHQGTDLAVNSVMILSMRWMLTSFDWRSLVNTSNSIPFNTLKLWANFGENPSRELILPSSAWQKCLTWDASLGRSSFVGNVAKGPANGTVVSIHRAIRRWIGVFCVSDKVE